ncbi:MAG: hypothetical protein JJU02_05700 [Cryomorphaceae bacterium]|nr:hypothetical protein [Cryomorphaceae bacterium]
MKNFEKIIAGIAFGSQIMKLLYLPMADLLFILSMTVFVFFYFYLSFAFFNNIQLKDIPTKGAFSSISKWRIIGSILIGITISFLCIGILFKRLHWPGADINLAIGLIGAIISLIVSFIKYQKSQSPFYKNILIRLAIFGFIGAALLALPFVNNAGLLN